MYLFEVFIVENHPKKYIEQKNQRIIETLGKISKFNASLCEKNKFISFIGVLYDKY